MRGGSTYALRTPCDHCPFLRDGGVRLMRGRVREIAGNMLHTGGGEFHCHKTTVDSEDDDGEESRVRGPATMHCAGALIFAEKNGNATQMMRIAERLGLYDASALVGHDRVFDDVDEMLATALDAKPKRRSGRGTR